MRRREERDPWDVDEVFPLPGHVPSWLAWCGLALAIVIGVVTSRYL